MERVNLRIQMPIPDLGVTQRFDEIGAIYQKAINKPKLEMRPIVRSLITWLGKFTQQKEASQYRKEVQIAYYQLLELHKMLLHSESENGFFQIADFLNEFDW